MLMKVQEEIANEINESKVGKIYKVIIDSEKEMYYIARTEFDSPDVDGEVLIEKKRSLQIGRFYNVKITSSLSFDLLGEVVENYL